MHTEWQDILKKGKNILLFDGVCNLCNGVVQFVLPRDQHHRIVFASLQSREGKEILQHIGYSGEELKTIVLVNQGKVLFRSDAVLETVKLMGGGWSWLYALKIIPVRVRDIVYDWVASNRYKWFGKKDVCLMPQPEWRNRFLEDQTERGPNIS